MVERELMFACQFHGHLGPYLALGVRMGQYALRALNARKYFGIRVIAFCPPRPPASCLVDGLQVATGATYGKRNIEIIADENIVVQFVNTDTNESLQLQVPDTTIEQVRIWSCELGVEGAAHKVFANADALFEVVNGAHT